MSAQASTKPAPPVQAVPNGTAPGVSHHSEAPASATVKAVDPAGYEWLLTVRADSAGDMMNRVTFLADWFERNGWRPAAPRSAGGPAAQQGEGEAAPICAIHKTLMTRRTKDGRSWWSCNEKLDTGEWCPYRPKS